MATRKWLISCRTFLIIMYVFLFAILIVRLGKAAYANKPFCLLPWLVCFPITDYLTFSRELFLYLSKNYGFI